MLAQKLAGVYHVSEDNSKIGYELNTVLMHIHRCHHIKLFNSYSKAMLKDLVKDRLEGHLKLLVEAPPPQHQLFLYMYYHGPRNLVSE